LIWCMAMIPSTPTPHHFPKPACSH
jgi:hypothetical protein